MTISSKVLWTMLTDAQEAFPLIHQAAVDSGFKAGSPNAPEMVIEVPRSMIRRRRRARLTGSASPLGRRTAIHWTSDRPHPELYSHLITLEENLPQGIMYLHGLLDAADRAGLNIDAKNRRDIVRHLYRNELVHAAGKGELNQEPGFVVFTDRRLLFVTDPATSSALTLDMPQSTIDGLTLSKRISGEILVVTAAGKTIEISKLGHGEGHGIATSFRNTVSERARNSPLHDSAVGQAPGHNTPTR